MSGKSSTVTVHGRKVTLTNLEKPLFPDGFTKGDMVDYYGRVADVMLPLLGKRAVTLKRYPNGSEGMFFFEKHCSDHRPSWIKTVDIKGTTGTVNFCMINDVPSLLWAANLAAIELHVPMAKGDRPDRPTAMVFDLDPGEPATLLDCLTLGLELRDLLGEYDLESFPKTSGSKGLHLYVPLNTAATFEQTKTIARAVADKLVERSPEGVTANMSKALRKGKVFVDWSQNDFHKTTVCAYSLRARATPNVSTPVTWEEVKAAVKAKSVRKISFTAPDVLKRIGSGKNPFEAVTRLKQKLPKKI